MILEVSRNSLEGIHNHALQIFHPHVGNSLKDFRKDLDAPHIPALSENPKAMKFRLTEIIGINLFEWPFTHPRHPLSSASDWSPTNRYRASPIQITPLELPAAEEGGQRLFARPGDPELARLRGYDRGWRRRLPRVGQGEVEGR